jgi:DNA (cytosine-5)-methyltransferase 1
VIVGSLFSGAGLLDCGLHQAGIRHAWFVERDEFRRGLLERRWPGVPVHDDVGTAGAATLAPVDGIVGGFPCKGASSAGKRTGFAHPETALWSEFERIVRELRPRYVLVENVRDILSLHRGEVWGTVLGDLAALGYDVAWDCVPASAVGAPHGRDRVFAVARHAESVAGTPAVAGRGRPGALAQPRPVERALRPDGGDSVAADAAHGRRAAAADAGEPGGLGRHAGSTASAAADAESDGRDQRPQLHEHPPGELPAGRDALGRGVSVEWGTYGPAVQRWEAIHGPAPEPLIRRLDDGDAKLRRMRSRVDRSRLSALGDGVHVHVGRLLGDALMALYHADQEAMAA